MSDVQPGMTEPPSEDSGSPSPIHSVNESGVSELALLARQAFEERRRKHCLALTRAILKIDPANKDAQVIQSWVHSDIQRELDSVVALIRDGRRGNDRAPYRRAELLLSMILDADPDNARARTLEAELASLTAMPSAPSMPAAAAPPHTNAYTAAAPPGASVSPFVRPGPDSPMRESLPVRPAAAPEAETEAEAEAAPMPQPPDGQLDGQYEAFRYPDMENTHSLRPVILFAVLALVVVAGAVSLGGGALGFFGTTDASENGGVGYLDVSIEDGIDVFVDGQYSGTGSVYGLALAPGAHVLTYRQGAQEIGREEIQITAGGAVENSLRGLLGRFDLLVVPVDGVELILNGIPYGPVPSQISVAPGDYTLQFIASGYEPQTVAATVVAGERRIVTTVLRAALPGASQTAASGAPPLPSGPTGPPPVPASPASSGGLSPLTPPVAPRTPPLAATSVPGTLAVSSPTPVDIYRNGEYLGSTPVSLSLPPGLHLIEYRYGSLQKQQQHLIQSSQTTATTVTFELTLQIDARPSAEVFVEGIQNRPLGATPLNDVRLPAGSVLIFRNPEFPDKRHRVTSEAAIQITFP